MHTASARYGRPKGTGLDDRQRLASIAAALLANPKLKTTTAIRSLGFDDPSTIRRLRDKFNVDQGRLMAEARRAARAKAPAPPPARSNVIALATSPAPPSGSTQKSSSSPSLSMIPQSALFTGCLDWGACMVGTAIEGQAILSQYWLRLPPIAYALRGQLALNSVAVAIYMRSRPRKSRLN